MSFSFLLEDFLKENTNHCFGLHTAYYVLRKQKWLWLSCRGRWSGRNKKKESKTLRHPLKHEWCTSSKQSGHCISNIKLYPQKLWFRRFVIYLGIFIFIKVTLLQVVYGLHTSDNKMWRRWHCSPVQGRSKTLLK